MITRAVDYWRIVEPHLTDRPRCFRDIQRDSKISPPALMMGLKFGECHGFVHVAYERTRRGHRRGLYSIRGREGAKGGFTCHETD